jgi:adenylosuccinate synthase
MPNEEDIELTNTSEEINVTNPWQEDFRTGELDYDLIQYAVNADSGYHPRGVYKNLVLTCLDQRPNFEADLSRLKYFDNIYRNDSPQAGHTIKATI